MRRLGVKINKIIVSRKIKPPIPSRGVLCVFGRVERSLWEGIGRLTVLEHKSLRVGEGSQQISNQEIWGEEGLDILHKIQFRDSEYFRVSQGDLW